MFDATLTDVNFQLGEELAGVKRYTAHVPDQFLIEAHSWRTPKG